MVVNVIANVLSNTFFLVNKPFNNCMDIIKEYEIKLNISRNCINILFYAV